MGRFKSNWNGKAVWWETELKLNKDQTVPTGNVTLGMKKNFNNETYSVFEVGVGSNLTPNLTKTDHGEMIEVPVTHDDGTTETVTQQAVAGLKLERSGELYLTPKITGEVKLSDGFSLIGEATLNEGKAGIKYSF